jgi:hypothetical protein
VTPEQWEQARAWRAQDVSDAEIGRRLGVAHTTVGRALGPRGQAPGRDGGAAQAAESLFTSPEPGAGAAALEGLPRQSRHLAIKPQVAQAPPLRWTPVRRARTVFISV